MPSISEVENLKAQVRYYRHLYHHEQRRSASAIGRIRALEGAFFRGAAAFWREWWLGEQV